MKRFNEKEVLNKYPFLKMRDFDGSVYMENGEPVLMGLEIPFGWYNLFFQLCEDIRPILEKEGLLDSFYFLQVKEKFNQLICHPSTTTDELEEVFMKYEKLAYYVCTTCGKLAEWETTDYIASYCIDCWKDNHRHKKVNCIKFVPTFDIRRYKNGVWVTKTIVIHEEWKRYCANNKIHNIWR